MSSINITKSIDTYSIPTSAAEFLIFWQKEINEIPAKFRGSAKIQYEAYNEDYEWEAAFLKVNIIYTRPESAEETNKREKNKREQENKLYIAEREQLRKLREKHSDL